MDKADVIDAIGFLAAECELTAENLEEGGYANIAEKISEHAEGLEHLLNTLSLAWTGKTLAAHRKTQDH